MADYSDYWKWQQGEVKALLPGQDPPTSSLVEAFQGQDVSAADAIVLRGYLGRSDIMKRALDYLDRAKRIARARVAGAAVSGLTAAIAESKGWEAVQAQTLAASRAEAKAEAMAAGATGPQADELAKKKADEAAKEIADINSLMTELEGVQKKAWPHIPWRLYLTPRLDRYVDFHRSSLLAYRREARAERQDACTVWLRIFEDGGRDPIPYRVVHETILGPSFATWLGGELVDDYVGQSDSSGTAWGGQSGVNVANHPWTTVKCGQ